MPTPARLRALRDAAKNGDPAAQHKLALLYYRSDGIPPNPNEARRWFQRAAAIGHRDAQLMLSVIAGGTPQPKPVASPKLTTSNSAKSEIRNSKSEINASLHDRASAAIDEIESEMKSIRCWSDKPATQKMLAFKEAFAMDTMAFPQWLQYIFIPRVRQIIADHDTFPTRSMVGAQAVREFDGNHEAARLVELLSHFDALIEAG